MELSNDSVCTWLHFNTPSTVMLSFVPTAANRSTRGVTEVGFGSPLSQSNLSSPRIQNQMVPLLNRNTVGPVYGLVASAERMKRAPPTPSGFRTSPVPRKVSSTEKSPAPNAPRAPASMPTDLSLPRRTVVLPDAGTAVDSSEENCNGTPFRRMTVPADTRVVHRSHRRAGGRGGEREGA